MQISCLGVVLWLGEYDALLEPKFVGHVQHLAGVGKDCVSGLMTLL